MTYQEKRVFTSIITGSALLAAYCIYAWGKLQSGTVSMDNLNFWAVTMLKFVVIGIIAAIVLQILFHILLSIGIAVREKIRDESCDDKIIEKTIKQEMVEDERDKLIELKSLRLGFFMAGVGFIASLITLALGYSPGIMLNILFLSFFAGSISEGLAQLYYYKAGFRNG